MTKRAGNVTVRLSQDAHAKLQSMMTLGPYRLSITAIIERGIVLAEQELKRLNGDPA